MNALLKWTLLELVNSVDAREYNLTKCRNRRRARLLRRNTDPFEDMSEVEFVKKFRLGKKTVRSLVEDLTPLIPQPRRNDGISVETKILVALAFYASGSYQTLVGQSAIHNVSQNTVSRAVKQVTEALNSISDKYVKWPTHSNIRNSITAKFHQKFGIPGVLGCIDSTHVAIVRPHIDGDQYFNKKGFHSLNVMIICDSDLNILCMDASNPGSEYDSTVWQRHPLNQHLTQFNNDEEQNFLLGDSGYHISKTLMIPILDTIEGTPEHHYYLKHVAAHNTIMQCIGVLKARFRCLLAARALHYNPVSAAKIVNACCILHNISNATNAPVPALTPEETNAEILRLQHDEHISKAEMISKIGGHNATILKQLDQDLYEGRALQRTLVDRLWKSA